MPRGNQPDRNARKEAQSEIDDIAEDTTGAELIGDEALHARGTDHLADRIGTGNAATAAMKTKATPKTARQNAMQTKKGNQPPSR